MKSLVVLALLVAVGAAFFFIGRSADKTTSTLLGFTDQAATATASANVSAALASIEAFGAANGDYVLRTEHRRNDDCECERPGRRDRRRTLSVARHAGYCSSMPSADSGGS